MESHKGEKSSMNILDEDISNFNKDISRYRHYADMIQAVESNLRILVSNCHGVSCDECVGHRHNLRDGCPVCGSSVPWEPDPSLYRCKKCGSITVTHTSGDMIAIGVQEMQLELREDDDVI